MKLFRLLDTGNIFVCDGEGRIAEMDNCINSISVKYTPNLGARIRLELIGTDIINVESEKDLPFLKYPEKKSNVRKRKMQI